MHDLSARKAKNLAGYLFLAGLAAALAATYRPRVSPLNALPELFLLAAAAAIVTMTVSVFWLWKEERVAKLESWFGVIAHVGHCAYCFALWLSAIAVNAFGISLFGFLDFPQIVNFFLSWWAFGFSSVLLFEVIAVLWFKKLSLESAARQRDELTKS